MHERMNEPPHNGMWNNLTPLTMRENEQTHDLDSGQTIRNPEGASWRECKCGRSGFSCKQLDAPTNNRTTKGGGWMRQGKVSEESGDTWLFPPWLKVQHSPSLSLAKSCPFSIWL